MFVHKFILVFGEVYSAGFQKLFSLANLTLFIGKICEFGQPRHRSKATLEFPLIRLLWKTVAKWAVKKHRHFNNHN